MRSTLRTTVAAHRQETGLSAQEYAALIGKPLGTVKSLESGRLKLSDKMALKISEETGIAAGWLLDGDPKKRMVCAPKWIFELPPRQDWNGRELPYEHDDHYSRSVFQHVMFAKEMARVKPSRKRLRQEKLEARSRELCSEWFGILAMACKDGKQQVAEYLLGQFISDMKKRFGYDPEKVRRSIA